MTSPSIIGAILLAAGRSSRMGRFKPLLPLGTSTIIETCLDTIESAGIELTIMVVGHRAEELQVALAHRSVTFALNPDPDSQMSVSIALGVQALAPDTAAVFLALADQPAITASTYQLLMAERARTSAQIVVPEFDGHRGHPVLVDLALRAELLELDHGDGLRGFLDRHAPEVVRVPVDSDSVLLDLDTPEQYEEMVQICADPAANP
jgi:molybdenum cofactor cytidylyltransferase